MGEYLEIERLPSYWRKLVEVLFYSTTALSAFYTASGLRTPFVAGGGIIFSGAFTLGIWLLSGRRLPTSIWFAIAIAILANLTQLAHGEVPFFGESLRPLLIWVAQLLMACYLLQDRATQRRVLFFLSMLVIAVVQVAGVQTGGEGRLKLEGAGSSFNNPNDLAHTAGIFTVAVLFWSLRAAAGFRLILWATAALLFYDLLLTVSRGGLLSFGCGSALLAISLLGDRGVRTRGIVMIMVVALALSQGAFLLSDTITMLEERVQDVDQSARLEVYQLRTLGHLADTAVIGWGGGQLADGEKTLARDLSHNTFVFMHLKYGGIVAWVYLAWLITLGTRVVRMLRAGHLPLSLRLEVAAMFGMGFVAQMLSNMGHLFLCVIYVTAFVERYTSLYSRRQIRARLEEEEGDRPTQARLVDSLTEQGVPMA